MKLLFRLEAGYLEREGVAVIWLYLQHSAELVCILQIRNRRHREVVTHLPKATYVWE